MPSLRINKLNNSSYYFITLTVIHWYYLFDRHHRWQILADSLVYCQQHKKLKVYGFVFMLNHLHLLFSSPDAGGFIRDFKKFTSKELKSNIQRTEPHVLNLFLDDHDAYHFWQATNMPVLVETEVVFFQKLQYIHFNPVKKGYVEKPEYWYWSSANLNCELKTDPIVL